MFICHSMNYPLSVEHMDLSNIESGIYILEISNSETKFRNIVIE